MLTFGHEAELKAMFVKNEGKCEIEELSFDETRPWFEHKGKTAIIEAKYEEVVIHLVEDVCIGLVKDVESAEASRGKGQTIIKGAQVSSVLLSFSKERKSYIPDSYTDLTLTSRIFNYSSESAHLLTETIDKLDAVPVESASRVQRIFKEHTIGKLLVKAAEASVAEREGEIDVAEK